VDHRLESHGILLIAAKTADIGTAEAAVAMFMDHVSNHIQRAPVSACFTVSHSLLRVLLIPNLLVQTWVPAGLDREFEKMHRWVLQVQHKHYGYCLTTDGANTRP
jgi:hypothetical protein